MIGKQLQRHRVDNRRYEPVGMRHLHHGHAFFALDTRRGVCKNI